MGAAVIVIALIFAASNFAVGKFVSKDGGRPYIVEAARLAHEIQENGLQSVDVSGCEYVTGISEYSGDGDIWVSNSDYVVREIDGRLYRIEYDDHGVNVGRLQLLVNVILGIMSAVVIGVLIFVQRNILLPFNNMKNIPYELSKGNLTVPVKASKSRYFGSFVWGVDLLREHMEQQKRRELELQREKKTLLLSLSHDVKTPLSAIKLYAKALSKDLYSDPKKQHEVAENINKKADEIESFVTQITDASREDFLSLDVNDGEFYLSQLIGSVRDHYCEKMELIKQELTIADIHDSMIKGDLDRAVEVMQNVIENAMKYGSGDGINIAFSEEDGCILISVSSSGCTLADTEIVHIFDSFWRGSNSKNVQGSGLGLYICRQLMHKMGGEIFADMRGDVITVSAAFVKA